MENKYAEKLSILLEHAEGLLLKLHHFNAVRAFSFCSLSPYS